MGAQLRSLFHFQVHRNVIDGPPPNCIRNECYNKGEINTCTCWFCHPYEEEEE